MPEQITGAQSLIRSLEHSGVDVIFGIPGGAILPVYDPLYDSPMRHILVRHEQGAGHAASGYAYATGRVGVCMATSGPGATNLVTADRRRLHGLGADRGHHRAGAPAGHRHRRLSGGRHLRHHDADRQAQLPGDGRRRHPARSSPRRSTLPAAAGPARCSLTCPRTFGRPRRSSPGPRASTFVAIDPVLRPHNKQVREAAKMISQSRRPVLYVGGGILRAPRVGRAAPARRADRHPGRHHADGSRRVPRLASPAPGDAWHARHGRGGHGAAEIRPAHHARRSIRRPGHRQARHVRAGRRRHPRRRRPGGDR